MKNKIQHTRLNSERKENKKKKKKVKRKKNCKLPHSNSRIYF